MENKSNTTTNVEKLQAKINSHYSYINGLPTNSKYIYKVIPKDERARIVCDNLKHLFECLEELEGKENVMKLESNIMHQIKEQNIDPNDKIGLDVILF